MDWPSSPGYHKNVIRSRVDSCFVPTCPSNSDKFLNKIFLTGPSDPTLRKKWFEAVNRHDKYSLKTVIRCCEDHFDLEKDVENWMKYKIVGGNLFLKKDVVPHKFECQNKMMPMKPRSVVIKQKRYEFLENMEDTTPDPIPEDLVKEEHFSQNINPNIDNIVQMDLYPHKKQKQIQVEMRIPQKTVALSPKKVDFPNDVQNYVEYNLMGLVVKEDKESELVPTEFDCQLNRTSDPEAGNDLEALGTHEQRLSQNQIIKSNDTKSDSSTGGVELVQDVPDVHRDDDSNNASGSSTDSDYTEEPEMVVSGSSKSENQDPLQAYLDVRVPNSQLNDMCVIKEEQTENSDLYVGMVCGVCRRPVVGFCYICVQCADFNLCASCEGMSAHSYHYMLRVPELRPRAELQAVVEAVRAQVAASCDALAARPRERAEQPVTCEAPPAVPAQARKRGLKPPKLKEKPARVPLQSPLASSPTSAPAFPAPVPAAVQSSTPSSVLATQPPNIDSLLSTENEVKLELFEATEDTLGEYLPDATIEEVRDILNTSKPSDRQWHTPTPSRDAGRPDISSKVFDASTDRTPQKRYISVKSEETLIDPKNMKIEDNTLNSTKTISQDSRAIQLEKSINTAVKKCIILRRGIKVTPIVRSTNTPEASQSKTLLDSSPRSCRDVLKSKLLSIARSTITSEASRLEPLECGPQSSEDVLGSKLLSIARSTITSEASRLKPLETGSQSSGDVLGSKLVPIVRITNTPEVSRLVKLLESSQRNADVRVSKSVPTAGSSSEASRLKPPFESSPGISDMRESKSVPIEGNTNTSKAPQLKPLLESNLCCSREVPVQKSQKITVDVHHSYEPDSKRKKLNIVIPRSKFQQGSFKFHVPLTCSGENVTAEFVNLDPSASQLPAVASTSAKTYTSAVSASAGVSTSAGICTSADVSTSAEPFTPAQAVASVEATTSVMASTSI